MYVTTKEAQAGFYPTPPELAGKLLDGVKLDKCCRVLEPSAGTGNLIDALRTLGHRYALTVECCEIDPSLRGILSERFGEKAAEDVMQCRREFSEANPDWRRDETLSAVYHELSDRADFLNNTTVRIIHDDFLTMHPESEYDLILMNPPFSNGDSHLLKAISTVEIVEPADLSDFENKMCKYIV